MKQNTRSLRIGFVSTMRGMPWGGSEQLWSEVALELRRLGHEVFASVLRWSSPAQPLIELADRGVHVNYRPRKRHLLDRAVQRCLSYFSPGPLDLSHRRWLREQDVDLMVISQGGPWDGLPWSLACHQQGIPFCPVVHANSELWWPPDRWLGDIRTTLAGAEAVFFVSNANRRLMEMQCGSEIPQAEVIANPCKADRSVTLPWPDSGNGFHLACVGRLAPEAKGQDILFQVLAAPRWRSRPLHLHVYGTGPAEKSVRSLAALLDLPNVHFHGHVSDLRKIWTDNHALVLPSRFEGLPLAIIEAMMCARPVITTAVAGNTEVVFDNSNGFVAAGPAVDLLDEAMERAWMRRHEWRLIGERARRDALKIVPENPIGLFADRLVGIAARRQRGPVPNPKSAAGRSRATAAAG